MAVFLIISAILLWILAFVAFPKKILLSPALSYAALLVLSFARINGMPLMPLSWGMSMSWLVISIIVMVIIILQAPEIRMQSRGTLYILGGALAGMALGLLGQSAGASLNFLYALMIIATAAGASFGLLLFSNTPRGRNIAPGSGHFLRYLLAKGFPALVTIAQLGVACIILLASIPR